MAEKKNLKNSDVPFDFKSNQRLSVGVARTINLGNYESVKLSAMLTEDIPEGADLDKEYSRLWDECLNQIEVVKGDLT